jgi:hypothetical protein
MLYSRCAKAGKALYVSGMLTLDSASNLVGEGDVKGQTRHILETIKSGRRLVRGHCLQSRLPLRYGRLGRQQRGLPRGLLVLRLRHFTRKHLQA